MTNTRPSRGRLRWLILSLALFLGAQALEATHLHAGGIAEADCALCQVESNPGPLVSSGTSPALEYITTPQLPLNIILSCIPYRSPPKPFGIQTSTDLNFKSFFACVHATRRRQI